MPRIQDRIELITQRLQHHPSRWKRWLATGAGLIALAASFFLGLVILIIAVGVAVLVASVVAVRVWWLRRSLRDQQQTAQVNSQNYSDGHGQVIEGESRDISDQR